MAARALLRFVPAMALLASMATHTRCRPASRPDYESLLAALRIDNKLPDADSSYVDYL